MAELTKWTPRELFSPFEDIQDEMSRMFSNFLGRMPMETLEEGCAWYPAVDVEDEADHYALIAELPGLKQEDIKISVSNGTLFLKGERKLSHEEREGKAFLHHERCYGRFQRTFTLPARVDSSRIKANYKDGILEVDIPKSEEAKPKEIEIK